MSGSDRLDPRLRGFLLIAKEPPDIGERQALGEPENHRGIFCLDNAIKAAAGKRGVLRNGCIGGGKPLISG
jgi:hypothetical protein